MHLTRAVLVTIPPHTSCVSYGANATALPKTQNLSIRSVCVVIRKQAAISYRGFGSLEVIASRHMIQIGGVDMQLRGGLIFLAHVSHPPFHAFLDMSCPIHYLSLFMDHSKQAWKDSKPTIRQTPDLNFF